MEGASYGEIIDKVYNRVCILLSCHVTFSHTPWPTACRGIAEFVVHAKRCPARMLLQVPAQERMSSLITPYPLSLRSSYPYQEKFASPVPNALVDGDLLKEHLLFLFPYPY